MTDARLTQLTAWLRQQLPAAGAVVPLNGDASFRRYFRGSLPEGSTFIAVDSPPQTQKNREFLDINRRLSAVGIRVPVIKAYDLQQGFFLLEDLGNTSFAMLTQQADVDATKRAFWYQQAVALLPAIARIDTAGLPPFDQAFIDMELGIFTEWCLDKAVHYTPTDSEQQRLQQSFAFLAEACLAQPQIAMHRDFHCRNLMAVPARSAAASATAPGQLELAVIDYQDMVTGPLAYDLASLLFDCYVVLPDTLRQELTQQAFMQYQQLSLPGFPQDVQAFYKAMRLTAMQRHIKVLGIFCRLYLRDGKSGYLKDLPRVMNYVLQGCAEFPELSELGKFMQEHVQGHLPCAS